MAERISNDNEIAMYLHCSRCLAEKPSGISPKEWAQLEVGWTPHGLQVWCRRHGLNVLHVDFEGMQHPAITTAKEPRRPLH
jgi:hypothetical protein